MHLLVRIVRTCPYSYITFFSRINPSLKNKEIKKFLCKDTYRSKNRALVRKKILHFIHSLHYSYLEKKGNIHEESNPTDPAAKIFYNSECLTCPLHINKAQSRERDRMRFCTRNTTNSFRFKNFITFFYYMHQEHVIFL